MSGGFRRRTFALGAAALTLSRAQAQTSYPTRPVRLIIPFPPGQAGDIVARLVADELSRRWPERVVVENRPGGAAVVGTEAVARATPDGYTLGIGTTGSIGINPSVMAQLPYDAEKDFVAVTNIWVFPMAIVVHPSLPVQTIQELVAFLKANPGFDYASAGPATAPHMAAELFAHRLGLRLSHVPYRGSGPALSDLVAGNVKLSFDPLPSSLGMIRGGALRALAVTTPSRVPQAPELPTVAETVLPGYTAMGWTGLFAPAGTPPDIVSRINADVVAILREPAIQARIVELGAVADPGTPEEHAAFVRAEISKWREVARTANVRLE